MVHVPQKPATADPDAVVTAFRDDLARGAADEQRGEVDPGIDGQLQRTPESAVHLHDDLTACRQLPLALDHGHAIPAERLEQAEAGTHQPLVERDAFAVNTDTAGGRLLPQPAMGEHGHRPTAPAQREEPLADARDPTLQQHREGRRGERGQRAAARHGVGDERHGRLAPGPADRDDRTVRLDDRRKEGRLRHRSVALLPRRDESGLRHVEAARPGEGQHLRLVRSRAVGRQVGKWQLDAGRQCLSVFEHRLEGRVGHRQQHSDAVLLGEPTDLRRVAGRGGERIGRQGKSPHAPRRAGEGHPSGGRDQDRVSRPYQRSSGCEGGPLVPVGD